MLLKRKLTPKLIGPGLLCAISLIQLVFPQQTKAFDPKKTDFFSDTTPILPYPINDRRADYLSSNNRTIDLKKPSNIKDSVAYDPITRRYTVYEKIGNRYYRTPTSYSFSEFQIQQAHQAEIDYFCDVLRTQVARLRELSPLWEMAQEGIDLKSIVWAATASH